MPVKKPKKAKPPQVTLGEQAKIEQFLAFHQRNFQRQIKDYKATKAYKDSEMLHGQVDYWESAVAMLKWLRNINLTRKAISRAKASQAS